jgi:hypothetical protein
VLKEIKKKRKEQGNGSNLRSPSVAALRDPRRDCARVCV